mmetsp:Transcript_71249/g.133260  ORF Transcript_71249/g.133260 Transcript_71249/m.133260 type:complete len:134 (-) Transcript_71249:74-475(-)
MADDLGGGLPVLARVLISVVLGAVILRFFATPSASEGPGHNHHILEYELREFGQCDSNITQRDDCIEAAKALGIDTSEVLDGAGKQHYDKETLPPFCYYAGGQLRFDRLAQNVGDCSSAARCICMLDTGRHDL